MKIRKPDYYDRFKCIAGACRDSCCIGWEIDVDEERREAYRNVTGELGERLRTCIDWEEGHFILQGKEERCPFLNQENLCDLIIGLGEESLCDICREHPRYYEWYDDLTEVGVGLCCEAAAGLVLEQEEAVTFVVEDDGENDAAESESTENFDDTLEVLFRARETAYAILQNRKISIWNRLHQFLSYIDELQEALDFENLDEIEESALFYHNLIQNVESSELRETVETSGTEEHGSAADSKLEEFSENESMLDGFTEQIFGYKEMLQFCRQLEPIDELWPKRLDELDKLLENSQLFRKKEQEMLQSSKERDYEYEHLAVYFVYRYFMKCRMDGDIYSRGCLAVFCILLIRLLDIEVFAENQMLTKEMRVQNAKDCSKEIEYSEENLEILANLFWEHGFEKISACL